MKTFLWVVTPVGVRLRRGSNAEHCGWFETIGLPFAGIEMDRYPRGSAVVNVSERVIDVLRTDSQEEWTPQVVIEALQAKCGLGHVDMIVDRLAVARRLRIL